MVFSTDFYSCLPAENESSGCRKTKLSLTKLSFFAYYKCFRDNYQELFKVSNILVLQMNFNYKYSVLLIILLIFFSISSEAFSDDIEWKIYLKSHMQSGPILSENTSAGEEFIVSDSDITGAPSESQDIINALDGIKFIVQQPPVSSRFSIHIILNVQGNMFESAGSIPLFINLSIEAYVDGEKEEDFTFSSHSPMVITIPQVTLSSLLGICNLSRSDNLICVYKTGGSYSNEGIKTYNTTSGIRITAEKPGDIVGGLGEKLGFPSGVKIDTWSRIKLLFR